MKMSIREAINRTLHEEMARDDRVVVMGEDVASDQGGVYGITEGLTQQYGVRRVIDTPITESAIVGAGRRGADGFTTGSRAHVCRFSGCLSRPDPEPNCEVSIHVWWSGKNTRSDQNDDRGGHRHWPAAFANSLPSARCDSGY